MASLAAGRAGAAVTDVLYERTLMTAADDRCGLFAPPVRAALRAGQAQARNAALRAGASQDTLEATEARARGKAAQTPCGGPDLTRAAARVNAAYEGYARITRMNFPGETADWRADRDEGRTLRWRLAQSATTGADRLVFGLAGRSGEGVLLAVGDFPDSAAPYTARLVMRDADRTQGAYLDVRAGPLRSQPLSRRLPPPSALQSFAAEARSRAGADLAGKDLKHAWAFRFPREAAERMARLDPREAVAVEFAFGGRRETVRRFYVEVGDFAAGRAFLQLAR